MPHIERWECIRHKTSCDKVYCIFSQSEIQIHITMYTELPQRFVHNTYFTIYGIVKDFTLSFGKFTAYKYFLFCEAVYRHGICIHQVITAELMRDISG